MSFYIINQDAESPIMAIKSSSLVHLELIFKEKECNKWVSVFPEWFDGRAPFRAVWQRGDELRIRTIASHDDHSFEALISHPIAEREIEVLLTTLVDHHCLKQEYKQEMFQELSRHFAIMRLASLRAQIKELLGQLERTNTVGVVYLDKVGAMERFSITLESKKNILASMKQLKQMLEVIDKMLTEKKVIVTKEEIMIFRSFKPSCHIKSESLLGDGWFADKSFAGEIGLFVRDFAAFIEDLPTESLSIGSTMFGSYKSISDDKLLTPEAKLLRKSCAIL